MPCFYQVGVDLRFAQERFFQLATIGLLFASFFIPSRQVQHEWSIKNMTGWLAGFGIWTIFLYAFNPMQTGTTILVNILNSLLIYNICIRTLKKEDISFIFKGILFICGLNIIFLASQRLGFDPIFHIRNCSEGSTDLLGFFGLKAAMGMYFALSMSILAFFTWWLPILFFLPIGLSVSTGAMTAGFISYLFVLWYKKRLAFWTVSVVGVLAVSTWIIAVDSPMGMFKTRPPMWKIVLQDSFRNMKGHGLDSFRYGDVRYYLEPKTNKSVRAFRGELTEEAQKTLVTNGQVEDINLTNGNRVLFKKGHARNVYGMETLEDKVDWWDNPHNEYLHLFYEFGLPGVILIGLVLYSMAIRFTRTYKTHVLVAVTGAMIALLVASVTQFPFHLARIGHIVPILLSIFFLESE